MPKLETWGTPPSAALVLASAGSKALATSLPSDSGARFSLNADGRMEWSPGTGVADANLYRESSGTGLATDFPLRFIRPGVTSHILSGRLASESQNRLVVRTDREIQWGGGSLPTDVKLSRPTTGLLECDQKFRARSGFSSIRGGTGQVVFEGFVSGDTEPRIRIEAGGAIEWGLGLTTPVDTKLYRSADSVLKTDDSFHVANTLRHLGSQLGFFNAPAVVRSAPYTQSYSTSTRIINSYTPNPQSTVYEGWDNAQSGSVYAKLADLNTLRVAYENLRALAENVAKALNSVIDDMQSYGLLV